MIDRRHNRFCAGKGSDMNVAISFSHQVCLQFPQDILRILVWNKSKVDLGHCFRRQNSFCPLPAIATCESRNIAGWSEGLTFKQRRSAQSINEALYLVSLA